MILVRTQRVVGQQLHPLNVADRMQIRAQPYLTTLTVAGTIESLDSLFPH